MEIILNSLDLFGILVFSMSGYLTAVDKKLDFLGAVITSFVTAIGGGTIRDLLLGNTPVTWLTDLYYIYFIILGIFLCILFKKSFLQWRKTFKIFDTLGISAFTILGLSLSKNLGFSPFVCIMMGTITATFGGFLRDIFTNEVPSIMKTDFYATVCIIGGIFYYILVYIGILDVISTFSSLLFIIILRLTAIKYKWKLPKF